MENNQRVVDSCFDRMQARNGLTAKNQSQLGKLIPMLQLGAKNSKDGEAGLASLSDRMSSLRALIDRSREAFRRLPTMGTVSKERQLKRLTDALAVVKSLRDDGVPQGTAKALRALKNELTSLREIAYLGELNEETLDLTALRNWDVLLVQLLETSQTRFDEQRMLLTSDQEEQTPALSESELKDPVFSPKMKDVLNTVSGSSGSLPKPEAGAPFTLGRTSVIPVPKTMIDERVLKARGFKYQNLGGYFVLADQGVSHAVHKGLEVATRGREVRDDDHVRKVQITVELIQLRLTQLCCTLHHLFAIKRQHERRGLQCRIVVDAHSTAVSEERAFVVWLTRGF